VTAPAVKGKARAKAAPADVTATFLLHPARDKCVPTPLMAEYYGQRTGAGLIITEGTSPSPNGLGYPRIPGIHSAEQTDGWKLTAGAVHDRGGKIFIQLMHTGRVGSSLNLPAGAELVAPSEVTVSGAIWTDLQGEQPYGTPREMTSDDIRNAVGEYAQAAHNAIAAGFDGVEIHGANLEHNICSDDLAGDNGDLGPFVRLETG